METNIDYRVIGRRIKEKRKELGMTQEKLSTELNISMVYMSKIENGKANLPLDTLSLIAYTLDMNFAELITGTPCACKTYYFEEFDDIFERASKEELEMILEIAKVVTKQKDNE